MSAQAGPSETVAAAFHALARRDWTALRELVHPDALARLRQDALGMLILVGEQRRRGELVGGGYNPDEVVIADHLATVGGERARRFGGATIAQLAALSPGDFFVRWCDAAYDTRMTGTARDVAGLRRSIVGHVVQGESVAHVLYRLETRSQLNDELVISLPGRAETVSLELIEGIWRLRLNHELLHGSDITGMFDRFELPQPPRRRETGSVFVPAQPLHARERPEPSEVLASAFSALARRDWDALASFVDPERLAEFQQRELSSLIVHARSRPDYDLRSQQGVAVLVYQVPRAVEPEALSAVADSVVRAFPGRPTIGALARLHPDAFFARWCEAVYGNPDGLFGAMADDPRTMVGQVFEGEDVAHVLYSKAGSDVTLPGMLSRMSLRFSAGAWRLLLNNDLGDPSQLGLLLIR